MPDIGDFERDRHRHGGGIGWGEAFAALPQESPDAGGWQRVQARLPAPTRPRARWPLGLATAASLLLAVAIPLRMLPPGQPQTDAPAPVAQASPVPVPIEQAPAATPTTTPAVAVDAQPTRATRAVRPAAQPRVPASQRPIRTVAEPAGTAPIASVDAPAATDLEPLYAQSAQLEDLLAMARDQRVASGTSAALSDELDARVAGIDTALIQPGLSDAQRAGLWSRRVDALQQLVGIEATNRLYAARGQSYDAALVSID